MKKRGVGLGLTFYGTGYGNGFPDISRAEVELLPDGRVGIHTGVTEVGQGGRTVMTQIGAEVLQTDMDHFVLVHEDTSRMPDSGTAAATRQTYNTGNAVRVACEKFRAALCERAKEALGLNSTVGLTVQDAAVFIKFFPEKRITLRELAERYTGENAISVKDEYVAQTTQMDGETGQGAPYWPYTFNACAVEVQVDTLTGRVEVLDAVFAQDAGKAVNPHLLEGQMDGGFAMGLGYTLFEDLKLENGVMKNASFSKYLIPTALDMIDVENVIVEDPESTAPFGAKGIGEPVMLPIAPAILNAIYDAVGVRILELPVTPERMLAALRKAGKAPEREPDQV